MEAKKILVVDDEPMVSSALAEILKRRGSIPLVASNGHEALGLLKKEKEIDIVISDYDMPGMTGLELLQQIKEEYPSLPVWIHTGRYHEVKEEVLHHGADRVVAKPNFFKEVRENGVNLSHSGQE